MLALMCVWVAGMAVVALLIEHWLGWFLFFSPGWGTCLCMCFQTVLSVGITGYIFLS